MQPFDVAVVAGWTLPGMDPGFPRIPGNEFAGVVDRVGAGVTGVRAGDQILGFGMLNGYAEYVVAPAEQVTAKPAGMLWEVAGGFSAPAQTAHIALRELGVGAGDPVLVHGAAGAVGHVAVQLCRLWAELGVRTTPPARSAARLAELCARDQLTVHILQTFPLARAADAHRRLQTGNMRGKIVLTVE